MAATKHPALKVILCGEYGVGKSSLFRRFVFDSFVAESSRTSTLGFDHFEKLYEVEGRQIMLQLWDTGGLERVASMTTNYFKSADAAILVFGYDALESFNMLSHHMLEILTTAENAKIFVCGNKLDLEERGHGPSPEQVRAFYDEYKVSDAQNLIQASYNVSCKTRKNVHEMFEDIAKRLARHCRTDGVSGPGDIVRLSASSMTLGNTKSERKCCSD